MIRYAFWPDGTFCPLEDVEEYLGFMPNSYKVEDFTTDADALRYIDRVVFNNQLEHVYD